MKIALPPIVAGLLLLIAIASPQHYRNDAHTANESARVYAAQAVVRHGTLDLALVFDDYFGPSWRTSEPPNVDIAVHDGRYLLDKAPGTTLAAIPVVALTEALGSSYRWTTWLLALLLSAVPTAAFVFVFRTWGAPWFLAASTVLATPWLVYGGLFFGHAACAALVGIGFLLALGPARAGASHERRDAFYGGLALGGAVVVEYTAAIVVAIVLVALAADPMRRRRLRWVILGGLGPAIVLAIWNWLVFGAPWRLSYGFKSNAALAQTHAGGVYGIGGPTAEGFIGILFSAKRGLFFFAPWLVVGLAGAVWAATSSEISRAWRIALPASIVVFVLVIAGFPDWHGGRGYGPRYLIPAIPLLAIGASMLRERARSRYATATFVGLVIGSVVLAVVGAYGDVYSSSQLVNPAFEVNIPVLLAAGPAPTVWSELLPRAPGLVVGVAAIAALLVRDVPRPRESALVPVVIAIFVASLHLLVGTKLETTGPDAHQRVLRQRLIAHQLLEQPIAARDVERRLRALEQR